MGYAGAVVGAGTAVELRVLGPVQVRAGDQELPAGSRQQRAVLAVLAVNAGRLVPTTALMARVWGDDPPARARRTLQTYIAAIRRILEQAADGDATPAPLAGRDGGYQLTVDPDRVDLHRFRRLLAGSRDGTGDAVSGWPTYARRSGCGTAFRWPA